MVGFRTVLPALVVLIMPLCGCQQEQKQPSPTVEVAHTGRKEAEIVVPDAVRGQWKAVRIAVTDKSTGRNTVTSIPIGGKIDIPSFSMTLQVETFLPAFVKEGPKITSQSNSLKNPAAKVVITESGTVVFNGWLFSLFPNAHAFLHPRYGFTLVDVVPVKR